MNQTMIKQDYRPQQATQAPMRGAGLIEIMIAMLIFTVGVLSLATMQVASKRSIYEAGQRSVATSLARDISERMRSNPAQLDAYVVNNIGDEGSLLSAPDPNCVNSSCTPAQLATYDLADWEALLVGASEQQGGNNAGGLVSPRACITHNSGQVAIAIAWLGVSSASDPNESACGADVTGLYDDPSLAEGNNLRRRLLVLSTYIGAS